MWVRTRDHLVATLSVAVPASATAPPLRGAAVPASAAAAPLLAAAVPPSAAAAPPCGARRPGRSRCAAAVRRRRPAPSRCAAAQRRRHRPQPLLRWWFSLCCCRVDVLTIRERAPPAYTVTPGSLV